MSDKDFNSVDLPEGFTGSQLKWSLWWIDHKDTVKRVAVTVFIVFDVLLLSIAAWGIFDWLALGGVNEERAVRQLTSAGYAQLGTGGTAREVRFDAPIVLSLPDNRLDVVVPVQNENANFWVELDYHFVIGGVETREYKDFILPGQAKFLTGLGIRHEGNIGAVELRVDRRVWHRIDAHEVPDYESFRDARLSIEAVNPTFTPATGEEGSKTSFALRNRSAFSYYDADLLILLYRGDAIVGVNKIRLDELVAGAAEDVEVFWFQTIPQVTRTEVIPSINILDPGVYQPPG